MGQVKLDKSAGLKEQRNRIINTIKQRKAFLTTKEMIKKKQVKLLMQRTTHKLPLP